MKSKFPYSFLILFGLLIGILYLSGAHIRTQMLHDPRPRVLSLFTQVPSGYVKVVDTVDGDTIRVQIAGKDETLRFLGIDTPETKDPRKGVQCFGHEASDFTKSQVMGKAVMLEPDPLEEDRDKYGRLLRYIYLDNGTNLNELLVAKGFAFAYERFPTLKLERLKQLEAYARDHKLGLWGKCQVTIKLNGKQKSTQTINE